MPDKLSKLALGKSVKAAGGSKVTKSVVKHLRKALPAPKKPKQKHPNVYGHIGEM